MDALWEGILIGGLLPFATAVAFWGLTVHRGASGAETFPRLGATLGAGLGFFLGYAALSWTVYQPEDSWQWLPYLVLGGTVVGVLGTWCPWFLRVVLALGLAVLAAYLLVPELEDLAPERPRWLLLQGSGIFALWLVADAAMTRRPQVRWGCCWWLTLLAVAVEMKLAYINMFGQVTGLLLAPLTVFALVECKRSWRGAILGLAPIVAVTVAGLLFAAKFLSSSDVPFASYLWLLCAPLGFCLVQLLPERLGRLRSVLAYATLLAALGWGLYQAFSVSELFHT